MGERETGDVRFFLLGTAIGPMEFHPIPETLETPSGEAIVPMRSEFSCTLYINRMSSKRFKKLLMSRGLPRNAAEKMVKSVKRRHGLVPYSLVWVRMVLAVETEFGRGL